MEIKIVGDMLASCKVNMKQFRIDYSRTLDLKESIGNNFKVLKSGNLDEEKLLKHVRLGLDWGRILDLVGEIDKDEMEVRFYKCEFKDKVEFYPDLVSEDGRLFVFRQEIKEGHDLIMVNSFISNPDFDIRSYLNSTTFNYGLVKWKPLVEWGGGENEHKES